MTLISTKKKKQEKCVSVKMGPLLILLVASFIPLLNTLYGYHRDISTQRNITEHYFQRSHDVVSRFIDTDRAAAFDTLIAKLGSNTYKANATTYFHRGTPDGADINAPRPRENATLLMLVRNFEVDAAIESMRNLEDRFNKYYHYDWTFLNDVPFTNEFIEKTTAFASGKTQYALIPYDDWNRPPWIDEELFEQKLVEMEENNVIYGGSRSYRNMCRFNSGFFFRQKILENYDYYFRVEPGVQYFCDFPYDPFRVMRLGKKKYGFVVSLYEYSETIPSLWDTVEKYMEEDQGETIDNEHNAYSFLTDKEKINSYPPPYVVEGDYNLCHFWSNFEIGDLNFFRSDRYIKFFDYLDRAGGFYYERWGDAPVHSIIASLLLEKDEFIHFDQIAYFHNPYFTCPVAFLERLDQRCICDPEPIENIDIQPVSCLMRWWRHGGGKRFIREDSWADSGLPLDKSRF